MSLVELGRFSRNEAHILVGRLDSEGIDAIAFDGETSIGDGSYLLIPVRVMVDEDDVDVARRIVADAA
ncbi:putative signal transducing protein [Sphingomonas sp. Tas61C01]|uniref:putative signal transducing protein n=1 Tax=Sphingomonas sp. Tas61C01 TaxID=3458297 RepID=UPI00403EE14E